MPEDKNSKESGKDCNLAHSRIVNGLANFGWKKYRGLLKTVNTVGEGSVQTGRLYRPEQNIAPFKSYFPSIFFR